MSYTPAQIRPTLYQGDTFAYLFTFQENGSAFDLSVLNDISFRFFNEKETIFEHTVSGGDLTISGASSNELSGTASAETMDIGKRSYYLEVTFIFADGSEITYLAGRAKVIGAKDGTSTSAKEFDVSIDTGNETVEVEQLSGLTALAIQAKEDAQAAQAAAEQAEGDTQDIADQALIDITSAKDSALSEIGTAETGALSSISTAETDAITAIEQAEADGITAVNNARDQGVTAVESARDSAISTINGLVAQAEDARDAAQTAETNAASSASAAATSEGNAAGSATTAETQADRAETQANRAMSEADRAESEADSIFTVQASGTVISYDSPKVYGTPNSPLTGDLTNDFTDARLGVAQKIYHNDSVAPSFPGLWFDVGQNSYTPDELNIIRVEYVSDYWIEYRIEISAITPPLGLVSHWRFDGNVLDSAGTNDGTIHGDPQFVQGVSGQALSFDGVDDYVEVPHSPNLDMTDGFTISLRVKKEATGTELLFGQHFQYSYDMGIVDDRIKGYIGKDGSDWTSLTGTTNLQTTDWLNLVFQVDGDTGDPDTRFMRLYVDGVMDAEKETSVEVGTTDSSIQIGRRYNNDFYFNGLIDEARIYNRALSESEIQVLYNNPGI